MSKCTCDPCLHGFDDYCKGDEVKINSESSLIGAADDLYEAVEIASMMMGVMDKNSKSGEEFIALKSYFDEVLAKARGES